MLIHFGRPGVQKSRAVKAALGRRACWIDASATAFGLYGQLYRNRDRRVVIDDVDVRLPGIPVYSWRRASMECIRAARRSGYMPNTRLPLLRRRQPEYAW